MIINGIAKNVMPKAGVAGILMAVPMSIVAAATSNPTHASAPIIGSFLFFASRFIYQNIRDQIFINNVQKMADVAKELGLDPKKVVVNATEVKIGLSQDVNQEFRSNLDYLIYQSDAVKYSRETYFDASDYYRVSKSQMMEAIENMVSNKKDIDSANQNIRTVENSSNELRRWETSPVVSRDRLDEWRSNNSIKKENLENKDEVNTSKAMKI